MTYPQTILVPDTLSVPGSRTITSPAIPTVSPATCMPDMRSLKKTMAMGTVHRVPVQTRMPERPGGRNCRA